MTRIVIKGYGKLISGVCPKCPEKVSIFLREDEAYRNARCVFCGADIHGDGISGIVRDGHYDSHTNGVIAEIKVEDYAPKEELKEPHSHMRALEEYEMKGPLSKSKRLSHHLIHTLPVSLGRKAKKSLSS